NHILAKKASKENAQGEGSRLFQFWNGFKAMNLFFYLSPFWIIVMSRQPIPLVTDNMPFFAPYALILLPLLVESISNLVSGNLRSREGKRFLVYCKLLSIPLLYPMAIFITLKFPFNQNNDLLIWKWILFVTVPILYVETVIQFIAGLGGKKATPKTTDPMTSALAEEERHTIESNLGKLLFNVPTAITNATTPVKPAPPGQPSKAPMSGQSMKPGHPAMSGPPTNSRPPGDTDQRAKRKKKPPLKRIKMSCTIWYKFKFFMAVILALFYFLEMLNIEKIFQLMDNYPPELKRSLVGVIIMCFLQITYLLASAGRDIRNVRVGLALKTIAMNAVNLQFFEALELKTVDLDTANIDREFPSISEVPPGKGSLVYRLQPLLVVTCVAMGFVFIQWTDLHMQYIFNRELGEKYKMVKGFYNFSVVLLVFDVLLLWIGTRVLRRYIKKSH
ncbi:MAG: hypothetical protein GY765_05525, partial [bacterium]|nr:hypothetical protein [bacterium]